MRYILRNILKRKIKSNKIKDAWRNMQVEKYGKLNHMNIVHICDPRKRLTIKDSYY